jgi:FkbM family methyltransferase
MAIDLDMSVPYEAMVWLGFEERGELAALPTLLGPGDVFVDCGANIGLWSLTAAPLVAPGGAVIAFEANPSTTERLKVNAAQSAVIDVRNVAVADRAGPVGLAPGDHHNVARVVEGGAITVQAVRLDDELPLPPTGIKIDVEGLELEVLQGAVEILREHGPWVAVEFNTEFGTARRLADWPVHVFLTDLGYSPHSFDGVELGADWAPDWGYANVLYRR